MRRRAFAAIGVILLFLGAACAGSPAPAPPPPGGAAPSAPAPAPGGGAPSSPAAPADTTIAGQAPPAQALPGFDRMIVRNVTMTLMVQKAVDAYRDVERIAAEFGGYVAGSQFRQDGERMTATVTVRVPADSRTYAATMERLRGLAQQVIEEQGTTQEVGEEYVDLESRLRSLRGTEVRLLALYDRAERMEEVFAVQRELTTIRGQIEQIEGRKRVLESRSGMATITLQLREPPLPAAPPPAREWNPVAVANEALRGLTVVLHGLATVAIWLLIWLPLYAPLIVLWRLRNRLPLPRAR